MINLGDFSLRTIQESDLEWIRALRSNESTWSNLGTFAFIYDLTQKSWFESLENKKSAEYLVYCKKNKNIGIVRLTDIDKINRSMCVGGDILPSVRGKGYAKNMYQLIFKLGFEEMGMHRLWLFVLDTNERAKHIYADVGFKVEGSQREAIFRAGKFHDYTMMSILEKEYFKSRKY